MEKITVHFLGASGTVTGSKFLIETDGMRVLVDCGMFQGVKALRELNWQYLSVEASTIDVVLLTHGHMDHSGWLPRLMKMGFNGKVIATRPTLQIAEIILRDSAKIQMEDAERANREAFTKHEPAEPLYDMDDVEKTITRFKAIKLKEVVELSENVSARFVNNGHIIGSTFIELSIGGKMLVFSGDIGRNDDPLMHRPERPTRADVLFIESTYGDRLHPTEDTKARLRELITKTVALGGTVMIPSFAVERAQTLMYLLWQLRREKAVPDVPFIMDSPMGANVLDVFRNNPEWHRLSLKDCEEMCRQFDIIRHYGAGIHGQAPRTARIAGPAGGLSGRGHAWPSVAGRGHGDQIPRELSSGEMPRGAVGGPIRPCRPGRAAGLDGRVGIGPAASIRHPRGESGSGCLPPEGQGAVRI